MERGVRRHLRGHLVQGSLCVGTALLGCHTAPCWNPSGFPRAHYLVKGQSRQN